MEIDQEELKKDLEEQYATLENEVEEDKKKKRYAIVLILFLCLFLIIFGTTFSYFKIYDLGKIQIEDSGLKDLYVKGYEDAFEFNPNTYEYIVVVDEGTTEVEIGYLLKCDNCKIEITGEKNLQPGDNVVKVKIEYPSGEIFEYIIHVVVSINMEESNLDLKSLDVKHHELNEPFTRSKLLYVVGDVKASEDIININFELFNDNNKVSLKLNGSDVTRPLIKSNGVYQIWFYVNTELNIGLNKLEITVSDEEGNSKTYYLYLFVVEENNLPKVVELTVEYISHESVETKEQINSSGNVVLAQIVPGWESSQMQEIVITNNSPYNIDVNFSWLDVENNFSNPADLEYYIYNNDKQIISNTLPTEDSLIMNNIRISANSINRYYIGYKYKYREESQNEDQGKEFKAKFDVSISK